MSKKIKAGEARAAGPTVADTLAQDRGHIPPPLLESRYEFLGDEDIDTRRYTSGDFADAEQERLWPRTWQWACREEHLPDVGDSYVYDIGSRSVIIVRTESGEIQAHINACTHRSTRLLAAQGGGYSNAFTCPFHGWSWHLDGSIRNIPGRWDFPHVSEDSHNLRPVQVAIWGGFVFINLDPDAEPLEHYLGVLPEHFSHFPLEQRRIVLHVQKVLPANWKACQEAFIEAYHNFETHDTPNGGNAQYDIFSPYVTRFIHNLGDYSPESLVDYPGDKWRRPPLTETEQLQILSAFGVEPREVPEGQSARAIAAEELRRAQGERLGVDLSGISDSLMLDSIEYHLFPNMFFFAGITIPMVYRFRPHEGRVDRCLFDFLVLEPIAPGVEYPPPPDPIRLEVEQSYTEVEALAWLAPVFDEDTDNLALQQQGLQAGGKAGITLGNYQEARIRRVHLTLDEFLGPQKEGSND